MRRSTDAGNSRIVFHTWGIESLRFEAKTFLEQFDCSLPLDDINDVLEIYNVYSVLIKDSLSATEREKIKQFYSVVAKFFKSIDDTHFSQYHQSVLIDYYDDFLTLFERFKAYEHVSSVGFSRIFEQEGFTLYKILEYKNIVTHYDETLARYMLTSDQTAEIIIRKYLEEQPTIGRTCYLPKSLDKKEYERILNQYIESDCPHINLVNLISYSQSSAECPLSDELRQRAKHRAEELYDKVAVKTNYSYDLGVRFDVIDGLRQETEPKPGQYLITYNVNWLRENTDFKSILYNFIHLFEFTDEFMRCKFPVVESKMDIFEKHMGVKGIKEYQTGTLFRVTNYNAFATLALYYNLLRRNGVYLEDFIQNFFCKYLPEEFAVYGFDVNIPSYSYSDLDKCKLLTSEMDGVLKLFKMYVQRGSIDRELYEMSSSPVTFRDVPSLIVDKYAYANGTDITKEIYLCFSDQSMLAYIRKYCEKKSYKSFVNLVMQNQVRVEDYPEFDLSDLNWLIDRGTVNVSKDGVIALNIERAAILKDLYENEVIRTSRYAASKEIKELIDKKDLVVESALFSRPEQQYLNYMLNKSEYSNGKDLRNKYIHSSYSQDKNQHFNDYIELLRIMIVVIIKINEEFCCLCDRDSEEITSDSLNNKGKEVVDNEL